jgi:uncharacterized protein YkwD
MRRALIRLIVLIALVLLVAAGNTPSGISQNASEARWIHAQINRWRLGLELGPLVYNDTLEAMAIAQAEYVLSLPRWPENVHAGRNNEGPRIRARYAPYNWPTYGAAEQIAIGEIAWLGTRDDAMSFWHGSYVHRTTATNAAYREIGVAALPGGRGSLFVVVFGARPNVLPALADPDTNTLYLTDEEYDRGSGAGWIRDVSEVRLFDEAGRPVTDGWVPWQSKLPIPENAGESLYVLYRDGDLEAVDAVSVLESDTPLPEYAEDWVQAVPVVPTQVQPTPTPTPAPIPHIRVVYSGRSLTMYNTSAAYANVRSLEFVSGEAVYRVADFNAGFINGSLSALPPWNCLNVTQIGARVSAPPIECRHTSTTTLLAHQLFWSSGDFEVRRDGTTVAECRQSDEICEFDLP